MKILLFIDSLGSGGAQRQMVGLAKLLQDRGYKIKVIYYHPICFFRAILDINHIPNEYVAGSENKIKRIFKIARAIRQFQPNVVISYLDAPNMIVCLLKACGMKFRLITGERNTSQVLNCFERTKFFLMRWADVIVPNSFSQEQFIKKHYIKLGSKMKVITNYVDTELFVPQGRKNRNTYRILVVGRITKQKNTLLFLHAVNKLKDEGLHFFVDWYGRADDNLYSKCREYINNNQLDDFFSFHKPTNDIIREYQRSEIFCLPSLFEGFPNVICEAMSCGLPVICSNVCDNALLIENGKNGFMFDPNDVDDMASKIRIMLFFSIKKLQEMGSYSRRLAEEKFSKDSFVEKYLKLIMS